MFVDTTTEHVEAMMDIIKEKTQAAIKIPLFVTVDECMAKACIHCIHNNLYHSISILLFLI